MTTDDLDFLLEDPVDAAGPSPLSMWGAAAAAALEAVRGPMLDWAALALARRYPQVVRFRGPKGVLACRQDLDIHLKHLHAALRGLGRADLLAYEAARPALWRERGADPAVLPLGLAVLTEALWRFLPAAHATAVVELVTQSGWLPTES